tara:strand:+ start:828 stop:1067 length:240 start_codon:yes stop_codon:yes gene_type:complete
MKKSLILFLVFTVTILSVGCSSMKARGVHQQGGPYPGVRNLSDNYSEADWGAARVPAMILDLPFSTTVDTLALPLDVLK